MWEYRLKALSKIWNARWFVWSSRILAGIAAWDLFGAQFVPGWLRSSLPTVYEVVMLTTGWMPWWAWGWILTALAAVAATEYAARLHILTAPSGLRRRTVAQLHIRYSYGSERSIAGSDNVRHMEIMPDNTFVVEFKNPIQPRGLTARTVGYDAEISIAEVSRHRVRLEMTLPEVDSDILFESPEAA